MAQYFTTDYQDGNIPPPFPVHVFHPRVCPSATGVPLSLVSLHADDSGQHSLWQSAASGPLVELSVVIMSVRSDIRMERKDKTYMFQASKGVNGMATLNTDLCQEDL